MAVEEFIDLPVDIVKETSQKGSDEELTFLSEKEIDFDEVYSYQEQRAIVHRM